MLLHIPQLLTAEELSALRAALTQTDWEDGRKTAGHQAVKVKHNEQLSEEHPLAHELGDVVLKALARSSLFTAAALPLKVFPPLFNRYQGGGHFGMHIDTAVRLTRLPPHRVRTDLSATLFLTSPEEYEGGELAIEDHYGAQQVKLPAGDLLLYPASSLHEVRPVTRGARLASFFWVQSMVREDARRSQLYDLDRAIQQLAADHPGHPSLLKLTGVYHNLLRQWAEL